MAQGAISTHAAQSSASRRRLKNRSASTTRGREVERSREREKEEQGKEEKEIILTSPPSSPPHLSPSSSPFIRPTVHPFSPACQAAVALLPGSVLQRATYDHDPLPPADGINAYEEEARAREAERAARRANRANGNADGDAAQPAEPNPFLAFLASFNPNFNTEPTADDEQRQEQARYSVPLFHTLPNAP